ncbi:MAG: exonuclease SbcCD subunit D C-terminal domain-containing protein [Acutalibacteraceae bacterium]
MTPLRGLRKLRGTYEELTRPQHGAGTATDDYLQIILTDEEDIPDCRGQNCGHLPEPPEAGL